MTNTTRDIFAACLRCGQKVPQGAWTIETAQAVLEGARPAFVCPDCGIFEPSSADRESLQHWVDAELRQATLAD